ncbi:MAG: hypothetical protein IKM73_12155 [Acidaminococcaceae bacterium]|nr:hypothetical protein [Acidaminococcaceae bacterium]
MRYCPFCGAELPGLEVSFCAECGKQLPAGNAPQTEPEDRPTPVENQRNPKKKSAPVRPKREPKKKSRPSIEGAPTERLSSQSGEKAPAAPDPDAGYDGYYDDISPADAGTVRPGMDREMVKKIILLVAGALLVIGLCVVMMTLL